MRRSIDEFLAYLVEQQQQNGVEPVFADLLPRQQAIFGRKRFEYARGINGIEAAEQGALSAPAHSFTAFYAASPLCAEQKRLVDEAAKSGGEAQPQLAGRGGCGGMRDLYVNPAWRELLLLLRFRGIVRYTSPLYIFSRITLFAMLAALFASFFYSQVMSFHGIGAFPAL